MDDSVRLCLIASATLVLAACESGDDGQRAQPETDPAIVAALNAPIMTDPDLAGLNDAASIASVPSRMGGIPTIDAGPDAIAAAREDARNMAGGTGSLLKAPEPGTFERSLPETAWLTAGARADATLGVSKACADRISYTARWAAEMPAAFPVYPRAAVQEAGGTNDNGCGSRIVNFRTPVPLQDVMDFYFSRAKAAGFSAQHAVQGETYVLGGLKGRASYAVYARQMADGLTEVDLVTNGN